MEYKITNLNKAALLLAHAKLSVKPLNASTRAAATKIKTSIHKGCGIGMVVNTVLVKESKQLVGITSTKDKIATKTKSKITEIKRGVLYKDCFCSQIDVLGLRARFKKYLPLGSTCGEGPQSRKGGFGENRIPQ